jgi:hypothetical protein
LESGLTQYGKKGLYKEIRGTKMKKNVFFAALAALTLLASCTLDSDPNKKYVDSRLRGTWESTDITVYSGRLVIDFDTITITGYAESQTPSLWDGGDDTRRPFRDFAKGYPFTCYTEEGKLFIETVTGVQNIPYVYRTQGLDKYLLFSFGDRQEGLKRTGY